jgi:hypothetical protein
VTDGVGTPVQPVQQPALDPAADRRAIEPELPQLPDRDNTVLPRRQLSQL